MHFGHCQSEAVTDFVRLHYCHQCFDSVGWMTRWESVLWKPAPETANYSLWETRYNVDYSTSRKYASKTAKKDK